MTHLAQHYSSTSWLNVWNLVFQASLFCLKGCFFCLRSPMIHKPYALYQQYLNDFKWNLQVDSSQFETERLQLTHCLIGTLITVPIYMLSGQTYELSDQTMKLKFQDDKFEVIQKSVLVCVSWTWQKILNHPIDQWFVSVIWDHITLFICW